MNTAQKLWWSQAVSDFRLFVRLRNEKYELSESGHGNHLLEFVKIAVDSFDAYA